MLRDENGELGNGSSLNEFYMRNGSFNVQGRTATVMCTILLVFGLASGAQAQWKISSVDTNGDGATDLVVEGDLLKAVVGARGGNLIRLHDRVRDRQEAKVFSHDRGISQLRLPGVQINAEQATWTLTSRRLDKGKLLVQASAPLTLVVDGQAIEPVTIIRQYVFEPEATRIRIVTHFDNRSQQELLLTPWIKHLLAGGAEPAAFMTPYGAWESGSPLPHFPQAIASHNTHYLTPSNWISRTADPVGASSNTLATVTPPHEMFKVYTWRKSSEQFMTQEVIFAPLRIAPGEEAAFACYLTLTEPLPTPVYASPLLNIQLAPHPTGLPASTQTLTFQLAATKALGDVEANGTLVRLDVESEPQSFALTFQDVGPRVIAQASAPVALAEHGRYQITLHLKRDGDPLLPGAEVGDDDPVIIPLVVGEETPDEVVYQDRTQRESLFPRIEPRRVKTRLVGAFNGLNVFRYPSTKRCFETDIPVAETSGPVELAAAANEYESLQLVLTSAREAYRTLVVEADPLMNEDGVTIPVDRVSRFLYAETQQPSGYNPDYPLGRYPDALLATDSIEVREGIATPLYITYHVPADTPPGIYRGQVRLGAGDRARAVPVTMRVWNIRLPVRPTLDISASMKAGASKGEPMREMYLRYKATPVPLPVVQTLLQGEFDAVKERMPDLIARGVSRIYLGNSERLLDSPGEQRIREIEAFLKEHGWTDHFYVRPGMDEASPDRVEEMVRRCERWASVSSIDVMATYYYHSPDLFGHLDIYSRQLSKDAWIQQRLAAGDEFWRVNAFPSSLEDDPVGAWILYWQMADRGFTGTYIWALTAWRELDWGCDWWSNDGTGNLEATLIWHHETGLLPTIRLEAFRDAIEGHALLTMLEQRVEQAGPGEDPELLRRARALLDDPPLWQRIDSGEDVQSLRRQVGDVLSALNDAAAPTIANPSED